MRNKLLLLALVFLSSCSLLEKTDFYYKTYKHPSLNFTIDYPRTWDMKENAGMGSQVSFLSNNKSEAFRTNANIVVGPADVKDIDALSALSIQQLRLILNQYELITQIKTKLGNLDAFELRGRYSATEGHRIIRSIVAVQENNLYAFTFTVAADQEKNYTQIINHMIESFKL